MFSGGIGIKSYYYKVLASVDHCHLKMNYFIRVKFSRINQATLIKYIKSEKYRGLSYT